VATSLVNGSNSAPPVVTATKNCGDLLRTTFDQKPAATPAEAIPASKPAPASQPCPTAAPEPVQLVVGTPDSFEKSVTNTIALFTQADRDRKSLIPSTLAVKRMLTFELPDGQTFSLVIEVPVFHRRGVHYIDGQAPRTWRNMRPGSNRSSRSSPTFFQNSRRLPQNNAASIVEQ
jgi:hypothetical protein